AHALDRRCDLRGDHARSRPARRARRGLRRARPPAARDRARARVRGRPPGHPGDEAARGGGGARARQLRARGVRARRAARRARARAGSAALGGGAPVLSGRRVPTGIGLLPRGVGAMPRVSRDYLDRRREEILAAALRCFAREGFHRTTMQDIVAESGLSPGALYRYFAAKEDLIAAIAARHHAAELALLRDAAERADVRLALRALVRAFLE